MPFHLGSIPHAMETLLEHYGDRIRPGDVFVDERPLRRRHAPAGHLRLQARPPRGELIGFTCTTAHHGDVGGRLPGSSACDNTEIFQEGIRLPWLSLYAEGEPVEDVFKLIEANVRIPRMTFGDLGAQVAACSVAERALVASPSGTARAARRLMDALIDYTERLVRQEIATWPDGTASFTDYLGSDGVDVRDVPITAHVTIAGDEITADLTDSSPMVRGALNSTRSFVQACVYQAVRAALTVDVPNTAGAFRPIHVLTKPGTVAEVVMPGASSMRGVTGFRILDAVSARSPSCFPTASPPPARAATRLRSSAPNGPDGGASSSTSSSSAPGAGRPRRTATTAYEPGRASPRTSRSRSPSRSTRSWSSDTGSCPTRAAPASTAAASRSSASGAPHAAHVADRPLRPGQAPALRPRRRRPRSALGEPAAPPRRDR